MGENNLARVVNKLLGSLFILGQILIALIFAFGIFAIIISLNGGSFMGLKAFSEWRVLTPMLLSGLVNSLALVLISKKLLEIFESIGKFDPFEPSNGKKLKQIALILAVLECSKYLIQALTLVILMIFGQPSEGNLEVKFTINFVSWGAILVLFILSEIFKEGARLRKLNNLTI